MPKPKWLYSRKYTDEELVHKVMVLISNHYTDEEIVDELVDFRVPPYKAGQYIDAAKLKLGLYEIV